MKLCSYKVDTSSQNVLNKKIPKNATVFRYKLIKLTKIEKNEKFKLS